MNKVLLFGGTGEGRALAEWMVARDIPHTVCVATEYGETLLPAGAEAHVGRMDSGEMEALMRAGGYSLAVDATHPYAVEVTEHIRAAAEAAGLPVLRLVRQPDGGELCRRAKDMAGAADMLEQMPGHVLLTTGSKELEAYTAVEGWRERLLDRGILIRSCADFQGLGPGFYRVCVRSRGENKRLIQAIQQEREAFHG